MQRCDPSGMLMFGDGTAEPIPANQFGTCENSTNQLFSFEGQSLVSKMTSLDGKCVGPVGASSRLIAGECEPGRAWERDALTGVLKMRDANGTRCVHVFPKPGPPPPSHVERPEVWVKPLPGKSAAVALFNRGNEATTMAVDLSRLPWLGGGSGCKAKNVWDGGKISAVGRTLRASGIRRHQAVLYVVSGCDG